MNQKIINIILCGGFGSRLWPLSRENFPKPLLPIFNGQSLLSLTLQRHKELVNQTIIITNEAQVKNIQAEVAKYNIKNVDYIVEPLSKNTGPAITMAALAATEGAYLIVTPSDHYIPTEAAYQSDIQVAISQAETDHLFLFGIPPNGPSTEYGYIETTETNNKCNNIESFHEKPTKNIAQNYIQQPNFFWNSGIFCFLRETFLNELEAIDTELLNQCKVAVNGIQLNGIPFEINQQHMESMKKNSIDYALMEKSTKLRCINADFEWSDCGTFNQLTPFLNQHDTNMVHSYVRLMASNANHNIVFGRHRPIALHDVDNLAIIDTDDVILVTNRHSTVPVSSLMETIRQTTPNLTKQEKWENRPWGRFNVLSSHDGYKVKKISVNPGGTLSLQSHKHRQEHWVVVSGVATVEVDGVQSSLTSGESILIPLGSKHRLSNNGAELVIIIETQIGDYLGEDDISRYEDAYVRNK